MDPEQATHTAVTLLAGMAAATDEAEEALRVGDLAALLEALESRARLQSRAGEAVAALLGAGPATGEEGERRTRLVELVRGAAERLQAEDARLQIALATERQELMLEMERVDASNARSGRYHGGRSTAGGTIDFRR